jgi:beta-galactosidase
LHSPIRLLADPWGAWTDQVTVPTLDALDARLALFRSEVSADGPVLLRVGEVRDRAYVFLDGAPVGVLDREQHDRALMLPRGGRLEILVEDQGRVNYGPRIGEAKGLIGPVRVGSEELTGWSACVIDFDAVPALWDTRTPDAPGVGPTAWRTSFDVEAPVDHFLSTVAWGKGFAWVNGFNLGRYWRRGPQETLYVPGPLLRPGRNELVVLELDVMADPVAHFVAGPSLGPLEL